MSKKVTEITAQLLEPILAEETELELVDIEYKKEGANWFLRVFIDKDDGAVDIEDCSRISEKLSKKLDEIDPIPTAYFLEVSSPGAERPLKKERDFEKSVGKNVHIKTYEPIGGHKVFEGELLSFDGKVLEVRDGKQTVSIPLEKISSARRAVSFK